MQELLSWPEADNFEICTPISLPIDLKLMGPGKGTLYSSNPVLQSRGLTPQYRRSRDSRRNNGGIRKLRLRESYYI